MAISYCGVGLLGYGLKSAKALGLPVDPDLATGIVALLVLAAVWLAMCKARRKLAGNGIAPGSRPEMPSRRGRNSL